MKNLTELNFLIDGTNQKVIIDEVYKVEQVIHDLKFAYSNSRLYFKKGKKSLRFFTFLSDKAKGYEKVNEKDVKKFKLNYIEVYQQRMRDTEDDETGMRVYYANNDFVGKFEFDKVNEKYRSTVLKYLLTGIDENELNKKFIDITKFAGKHNGIKRNFRKIYYMFRR